jgi:hypothetical protein
MVRDPVAKILAEIPDYSRIILPSSGLRQITTDVRDVPTMNCRRMVIGIRGLGPRISHEEWDADFAGGCGLFVDVVRFSA